MSTSSSLLSSNDSPPPASAEPSRAPALPAAAPTRPPLASRTRGGTLVLADAALPMTLVGGSTSSHARACAILSSRKSDVRERQARLQEAMLRDNWVCEELELYLAEIRQDVQTTVERRIASSREWRDAGEADRAEMREDFVEQAWEALPTRPCTYFEEYRDALLQPPPADLTADDALIAKYGMTELRVYFSGPAREDAVVYIPTDLADLRSAAESLVSKGLMRRGADIPLAHLLEGVTIAQMRELVADLSPPKWTRRAQATQFLASVPDIDARIGRLIPLRSQFQRLPLPAEFAHIDTSALTVAWQQAAAKSLMMIWAYAASEDFVASREDRDIREWWPDVYEACCPLAKRLEERLEPLRRQSLPKSFPTHFGCCVRLRPSS